MNELVYHRAAGLDRRQYERLIYVDSDLYLRSLPDALMHMPLPTALAAVPACMADVFNSGVRSFHGLP